MSGLKLRKLERITQIPPEPDALQIESVARGSAASLRGLRAGDIILAANQKPVHSEDDLRRIAEGADRGLALDILRGNGRLILLIQ
jgi:S1-C subfamily serine protease